MVKRMLAAALVAAAGVLARLLHAPWEEDWMEVGDDREA